MRSIPPVKIQGNSILGLISISWMIIAAISGLIFTFQIGVQHKEILDSILLIISFWKAVFIIIGLVICTMIFMFFPPFLVIGIPQAIYVKYKERKKNEHREDGTKNRKNPIFN